MKGGVQILSETERTTTSVYERIVGRYGGTTPGAAVFVLGGVHGNEPSGILAARRVLAYLEKHSIPFKGSLLALSGNLTALRMGERYIERDLNRMWEPSTVARLRASDPEGDNVEQAEQRELLSVIDGELENLEGAAVFIDLHSSSAAGSPFTVMNDTLQNRKAAFALPCPVLIGLEENVKGPLLEYVAGLGHVSIAVEGGEHDSPQTVDRHETAIWLTLITAGCIEQSDAPNIAEQFRAMKDSARGLPGVLEIVHRHGLVEGDGFQMEPGFMNFSAVSSGRVVAQDQLGEIRIQQDGFLLLPLYQGQGEDGFFMGREVKRRWLRLSTLFRVLRLDHLMRLLPGVSRHPELPDALLADERIVRWFAAELFHLMGYKRCPSEEGRLVFLRRPDKR